MPKRMSAFEIYMRTGRRILQEPDVPEVKFNPWHDPENGRFTFAGRGRHYGGGHTASNAATVSSRGSAHRPQVRSPNARPLAPTPAPVRRSSNQDSAAYLQDLKKTLERFERELAEARRVPASNDLIQRLKRHMIPEEGDRNDVYLDNRGIPTVGIGHKVVPSDKLKVGDRISDARKEEFWRQDSLTALQAARKQMKMAGIRDPNFAVPLASVNFQLGPDWYKEHKRTWSLMIDGDYEAAAREAQDSDWHDQTPERVKAFQRALLALRRKQSN